MEGKIVVYSDETGLGKIITPEKKKYNFSVDAWDDYDTMPSVGMKVRFRPEGIRAEAITPLEGASAAATPDKPAATPADKTPPGSDREASDTDETPPASENEPEVDVETAIQIHFADTIKNVNENRQLLNENRRLDFLKMRRFLTTAYNNLIEIDQSFENFALAEIRRQLMEAYAIYREFKKKTAYLANAYEQVFLSRQHRYKELRAKIELNRAQIATLKDSAGKREEEIQQKSAELNTLKPQSDRHLYLTNEIKLLKRTLVDAIHEIGKLTDENRLYIDLLDNFYKAHYDRFKKVFGEFAATYESLLRKMMDVLAYKFDAMMWEKANRSQAIQKFFLEAGITDEFSSITYLKYYIKSLDASKLNEENQQLLDLLKYLEEKQRHRIVCIDEESDFLTLVRQVIHEIDHNIKVTLSSRPEQVLADLKNIRPDIFIINPEMRGLDLDTAIGYIREKIPDIEVAFFAKKINRMLLLTAKRHNAAAIIPKTNRRDELHEQFAQYIT